jgi:cephalosporin-C deacetylase-like acetyl esterase
MTGVFAVLVLAATAVVRTETGPKSWTEVRLGTDACLAGEADREIPVYGPGEDIVFRVRLGGFSGVDTRGFVLEWERTADDGLRETGKAPLGGRGFVYRTRLDRPGFVRFKGSLKDADGRTVKRMASWGNLQPVECDLGAGVAVDKIRPAVPAPADFDRFWAERRRILSQVPLAGVKTEAVAENGNVRVFAVTCPSAGPRPVTGFLSVPVRSGDGIRFPATAAFAGYNASWSAPSWKRPDAASFPKDRLHFAVSAHGFELMREAAYYTRFRDSVKSGGYDYAFDPKQNADPETAYFSGMSYRVMRALEYLKSRPEWDGKNLQVTGGSMGGMQAVWGAALDKDVSECTVFIPWNCDIGGVEAGRNRGDWHLRWVPALGYYDTANHAARIAGSCKVNVFMAGLGDYICPPSGVMAFYNSLGCAKSIVFRQNARHGDFLQPDSVQRISLKSAREPRGRAAAPRGNP